METILVVDDDAQVLAIVRKMLEGYRILNALNAEEVNNGVPSTHPLRGPALRSLRTPSIQAHRR